MMSRMTGGFPMSEETFVLTPFFEQNERHTYEKCQYDEFKKRVAKMNELREAKGGARSN